MGTCKKLARKTRKGIPKFSPQVLDYGLRFSGLPITVITGLPDYVITLPPDYVITDYDFSKDYRLRKKIGLHDYGLQFFAGLRITIFPKITEYEKKSDYMITDYSFCRITDYDFSKDYRLRKKPGLQFLADYGLPFFQGLRITISGRLRITVITDYDDYVIT